MDSIVLFTEPLLFCDVNHKKQLSKKFGEIVVKLRNLKK